jgi:transposase-like protein
MSALRAYRRGDPMKKILEDHGVARDQTIHRWARQLDIALRPVGRPRKFENWEVRA